MKKTYCGADCSTCSMNNSCKGCIATKGKPWGKECMLAKCSKKHHSEVCDCGNGKNACSLKQDIIDEFNALNIKGLKKITELFALKGSFVNMEYVLENGQKVKLLDDDKIYLGNQIEQKDSDRCFGLAADEKHLLVCEYGENGTNPEIIVFQKRL